MIRLDMKSPYKVFFLLFKIIIKKRSVGGSRRLQGLCVTAGID